MVSSTGTPLNGDITEFESGFYLEALNQFASSFSQNTIYLEPIAEEEQCFNGWVAKPTSYAPTTDGFNILGEGGL